jgi:outer membrane lipoprotein LolB
MAASWPSHGASVARWATGRWLVVLFAGSLVACATAPEATPDRVYTGRFSAIATQGDKRESISGRFSMEVRGDRQRIDLATPLGTTVARIEVGPDGASANGPGMQEARGPDADALAEQLLGWRLPVSGLPDWIEGRPVPSRPARVDRDGSRLLLIEQDGWTVQIAETFASSGRPRLIVLERAASPLAPGVVLRLVVDDPAAQGRRNHHGGSRPDAASSERPAANMSAWSPRSACPPPPS